MQPLRFTQEQLTRPEPSGIAVVTTLRHFAILTWAIEPERLRAHLHPRFEPDCIQGADGTERALISAVPFYDVDFRLVRCPWPSFAFGQTNYRAYVVDTKTGERVAWFFGTCLGSWSVLVPRLAWKLPWYRGRFHFDCEWSAEESRYTRYLMRTESAWAPARLELRDTGEQPEALAGFCDLETAKVVLTHPLRGIFHRRDGRLGSYSVWHDELALSRAEVLDARFDLLDKLELVPFADQTDTHSALVQHETEFTIYLPPRAVE